MFDGLRCQRETKDDVQTEEIFVYDSNLNFGKTRQDRFYSIDGVVDLKTDNEST